jgi:Protein of unknown function (DUF3592)
MTKEKRAKNLSSRLPAGPGMIFGGFYVVGWGIREVVTSWRLRQRGLIAEGTVVENVRCTDPASGPSWAPVIAFTDNTGNRVEFTPRARGTGLGLSTGRKVEVIYLPEASQDARVNTWQHLLVPGLLAGVLGLVFLAVAFILLLQ